jgi:hypothetical protein
MADSAMPGPNATTADDDGEKAEGAAVEAVRRGPALPPAGYVPPTNYEPLPEPDEEEEEEDSSDDGMAGPLPASSKKAQKRAAAASYLGAAQEALLARQRAQKAAVERKAAKKKWKALRKANGQDEDSDDDDDEEEADGAGSGNREEWMMVPPQERNVLSSVLAGDNLMKHRQFSRTTLKDIKTDSNWTDSPEEKQRKAEEARRRKQLGLKPKGEEEGAEAEGRGNVPMQSAADAQLTSMMVKLREARGPSLVEQHQTAAEKKRKGVDGDTKTKGGKGASSYAKASAKLGGWNRERDMGDSKNKMTGTAAQEMVKQAAELGGRFSNRGFSRNFL